MTREKKQIHRMAVFEVVSMQTRHLWGRGRWSAGLNERDHGCSWRVPALVHYCVESARTVNILRDNFGFPPIRDWA